MPDILITVAKVFVAFLVAYFAALWFGLVVWTWRDIQKRTNDVLLQVVATLFVLAFSFIGLPLYLILRPQETLAEANARSLEEETLLQDMEEREVCPNCGARTQPDFVVCPSCTTKLKRECPACDRLLRPEWVACPYCATPVEKEPQPTRSRRQPITS